MAIIGFIALYAIQILSIIVYTIYIIRRSPKTSIQDMESYLQEIDKRFTKNSLLSKVKSKIKIHN